MIELWSKDQIDEKLPRLEVARIGQYLQNERASGHDVEGMSVAGQDVRGGPVPWSVEKFADVPTESVFMVLQLVGKSLIVEARQDVNGVKVRQVFRRKRLVPVTDYVDLKTLNEDPGVSTTFDA